MKNDKDTKTNKMISDMNSGTKELHMKLPVAVKNYTSRNLSTCSVITSKKTQKHIDYNAIGYCDTKVVLFRNQSFYIE